MAAETKLQVDVELNTSQIENTLNSLGRSVSGAVSKGINGSPFTQVLGRITGKASEFQKSMDASNARVLAFGASAGSIFLMKEAFEKLVDATIEVDRSLTEINSLFRVGQGSLAGFSTQLFKVANLTGVSFNEAAKAALVFAHHGLNMEETLKRTASALALSRASGMGFEDSVLTLTSTINSFTKESLDAVEIVDKLAAVGGRFAASENEIAEAFRRVGSSANEANVTFDQTLALITAAQQVTQRGGSVIGNSLSTIFTRLQRPQVLDDLEVAGVKVRDLHGKMLPMLEILKNVSLSFDSLSTAQKSFVSEAIGGVRQVNTLKAILQDLGSGVSLVDSAMQQAAGGAGSMQKRMEQLNSTISSQLIRTMNDLTKASAEVGNVFLNSSLRQGIDFFDNIINSISNIFDPSKVSTGIDRFFGEISQGLVKGLGNVLSGPGLQFGVVIIAKLFDKLAKFIFDSTKDIAGLDAEAKKRVAIEQDITSFLEKQPGLFEEIVRGQKTANDLARIYLETLEKSNSVIRTTATIVQSVGLKAGPHIVSSANVVGAATGYVPDAQLAMRTGGYMAQKSINTIIRNGSQNIPAQVNSSETLTTVIKHGKPYDFVNPPRHSPAGKRHEAESMSRTGINPYLLPQNSFAYGKVPNLAMRPAFGEDLEDNIVNYVGQYGGGFRHAIDYKPAFRLLGAHVKDENVFYIDSLKSTGHHKDSFEKYILQFANDLEDFGITDAKDVKFQPLWDKNEKNSIARREARAKLFQRWIKKYNQMSSGMIPNLASDSFHISSVADTIQEFYKNSGKEEAGKYLLNSRSIQNREGMLPSDSVELVKYFTGVMGGKRNLFPNPGSSALTLASHILGKDLRLKKSEGASKISNVNLSDAQKILSAYGSDFPIIAGYKSASNIAPFPHEQTIHDLKVKTGQAEGKDVFSNFKVPVTALSFQKGPEYLAAIQHALQSSEILNNFRKSIGISSPLNISQNQFGAGFGSILDEDMKTLAKGLGIPLGESSNSTLDLMGWHPGLNSLLGLGKNSRYAGGDFKASLAESYGSMLRKIFRTLVGDPDSGKIKGPVSPVPPLSNVPQFNAKSGNIGILDADNFRTLGGGGMNEFDSMIYGAVGTIKPLAINWGPMGSQKTSESIKTAGGENFVKSRADLEKYGQFILNKTDVSTPKVRSGTFGLALAASSHIKSFIPPLDILKRNIIARNRGDELKNVNFLASEENLSQYKGVEQYLSNTFGPLGRFSKKQYSFGSVPNLGIEKNEFDPVDIFARYRNSIQNLHAFNLKIKDELIRLGATEPQANAFKNGIFRTWGHGEKEPPVSQYLLNALHTSTGEAGINLLNRFKNEQRLNNDLFSKTLGVKGVDFSLVEQRMEELRGQKKLKGFTPNLGLGEDRFDFVSKFLSNKVKKPITPLSQNDFKDVIEYLNKRDLSDLNKDLNSGYFAGAFPFGRKKDSSVANLLKKNKFQFNKVNGSIPSLHFAMGEVPLDWNEGSEGWGGGMKDFNKFMGEKINQLNKLKMEFIIKDKANLFIKNTPFTAKLPGNEFDKEFLAMILKDRAVGKTPSSSDLDFVKKQMGLTESHIDVLSEAFTKQVNPVELLQNINKGEFAEGFSPNIENKTPKAVRFSAYHPWAGTLHSFIISKNTRQGSTEFNGQPEGAYRVSEFIDNEPMGHSAFESFGAAHETTQGWQELQKKRGFKILPTETRYFKGLIPNLFNPISEALARENRVTHGHAKLDSHPLLKSSQNPLGLVAIDSRNQSSAGEAITQHMMFMGQSLNDVKHMKSSDGYVPNLALNFVEASATLGMLQYAGTVADTTKWMKKLASVIPFVISAEEREAIIREKSIGEYQKSLNNLLTGEKKSGKWGREGKTYYSAETFEKNHKEEITGLVRAQDEYKKKRENDAGSLSSLGWRGSIYAGLAGGVASQFAGTISPAAGEAVNNLAQGASLAFQSLAAFPNKLGKALAWGAGVSAVTDGLDTLVKGLANAKQSYDVEQSKSQRLVSQIDTLINTLGNWNTLVSDAHVTTETLVREQRKYSETLAQLQESPRGQGVAARLSATSDNVQRISILNNYREEESRQAEQRAALYQLQEYTSKRTAFGKFGTPLGYSTDADKENITSILQGNAGTAISNFSDEFKTKLSQSIGSLEDFNKAIDESVAMSVKGAGDFQSYLNSIAQTGGKDAATAVKEQIRASLINESVFKNPKVIAARAGLIERNEGRQAQLDNAQRQETNIRRFFLNQGALKAGNLLDVRGISEKETYNLQQRQRTANVQTGRLYQAQYGERTNLLYNYQQEQAQLEADRAQKINEAKIETNKGVAGLYTQSFESNLAQGLSKGIESTQTPQTIADWKTNAIAAVNQGLSSVLSSNYIGDFKDKSGRFNEESFANTVALSGTNDTKLQDFIRQYLSSNAKNIELLSKMNETDLKIANINQDAKSENANKLEELKGALAVLDFKRFTDYLGGKGAIQDRGTRRQVERSFTRGLSLLQGGGSPESQSEGATYVLDAIKRDKGFVDTENDPLAKLAHDKFISGTVKEQQDFYNREASRIKNPAALAAFQQTYGGNVAQQTAIAERRFKAIYQPESGAIAGGASSAINAGTQAFKEAFIQSAAQVQAFGASLNLTAEDFRKKIDDLFKVRTEVQGAKTTDEKNFQKIISDAINQAIAAAHIDTRTGPQQSTNIAGNISTYAGNIVALLIGLNSLKGLLSGWGKVPASTQEAFKKALETPSTKTGGFISRAVGKISNLDEESHLRNVSETGKGVRVAQSNLDKALKRQENSLTHQEFPNQPEGMRNWTAATHEADIATRQTELTAAQKAAQEAREALTSSSKGKFLSPKLGKRIAEFSPSDLIDKIPIINKLTKPFSDYEGAHSIAYKAIENKTGKEVIGSMKGGISKLQAQTVIERAGYTPKGLFPENELGELNTSTLLGKFGKGVGGKVAAGVAGAGIGFATDLALNKAGNWAAGREADLGKGDYGHAFYNNAASLGTSFAFGGPVGLGIGAAAQLYGNIREGYQYNQEIKQSQAGIDEYSNALYGNNTDTLNKKFATGDIRGKAGYEQKVLSDRIAELQGQQDSDSEGKHWYNNVFTPNSFTPEKQKTLNDLIGQQNKLNQAVQGTDDDRLESVLNKILNKQTKETETPAGAGNQTVNFSNPLAVNLNVSFDNVGTLQSAIADEIKQQIMGGLMGINQKVNRLTSPDSPPEVAYG